MGLRTTIRLTLVALLAAPLLPGPAAVAGPAAAGLAVAGPAPAGLAVAGPAAAGPAAAGAAVAGPAVVRHGVAGRAGTIAWRPCPDDPSAECGTLRLPVDWSRPYGARFDLALARRRATGPGNRIGSLLVNPGGPGGSGVDLAMSTDFFSPLLRRHFDIVGFDPRGVGRSSPVRCTAALVAAAPPPVLRDQADFAATVAYNRRLAADCRRHTGALFDHVDTLSVVRDIDALRAAVGDPGLSFYGVSYGTLMAQQYAERHPDRVRALVLDSSMDHSLDTRGFLVTGAAAVQDSFDEFVAWCGRDPRCALHGRPVRQLWRGLLARSARTGLPDPFTPGRVLAPADLIAVAFESLYTPEWYSLGHYLQSVSQGRAPESAVARRAAARAAKAPGTARFGPGRGTARSGAPVPELVDHPFPAVFCADWRLPIRDHREYAAHLARLARVAPDMRYSPLTLGATTGCLGWPYPVRNPQHRLRVTTDRPLLLVHGRHDPATAHAWATAVAGQLGPGATLVTYQGWGHGAYRRGRCPTATIDRYLIAPTSAPAAARCAAVPPEPFGVGGTGLSRIGAARQSRTGSARLSRMGAARLSGTGSAGPAGR